MAGFQVEPVDPLPVDPIDRCPVDPLACLRERKKVQRAPKGTARRPQEHPTRAPEGPTGAQEAPKSTQRDPERTPRRLQEPPKAAQDSPDHVDVSTDAPMQKRGVLGGPAELRGAGGEGEYHSMIGVRNFVSSKPTIHHTAASSQGSVAGLFIASRIPPGQGGCRKGLRQLGADLLA